MTARPRSAIRPGAGVAALVGILSGCVAATPEPEALTRAVEPAAMVAVATEPGEFPATETTPSAASASPKIDRPLPQLSSLDNLEPGGLRQLLGAPDFTRRDDPAQLWQYRGDRCTLDIFLYRSPDGTDYRVNYFGSRSIDSRAGGEPISTTDCFRSVIANGHRKAG